MEVKAIAHSYWRSVKRGKRSFLEVHDNIKQDVKFLAQADVLNGVITQDQYEAYIVEEFSI